MNAQQVTQLEDSIKKGMEYGYTQNLILKSSFDNFQKKVREYLLTVNVAQNILKWNSSHSFIVHLEYPSKDFYKNAFLSTRDVYPPGLSGEDILFVQPETITRSTHAPYGKPKGLIDIAIMEERNEATYGNIRSIVGIEIKAINQSRTKVIEDVNRLANSMITNDIVSENSIEVCYSVFVQRLDKDDQILTKAEIAKKKNKTVIKWTKHIAKKCIFNGLTLTLIPFDIEVSGLEDVANMYDETDDASEVANATGAVIGFLIKIERI